MKNKYIIIIAILSTFVCLCYIYMIPFQKVHKIKSILQSKNTDVLSKHIDFPLLRENVKSQLKASFIKEMNNDKETKDNPGVGWALGLGTIIIDKMVDSFITPSGIHSLIMGRDPRNFNTTSNTNPSKSEPEIQMSYQSLNQFKVSIVNEEGSLNNIQLILTRIGLNWKLTNIIFSLSTNDKGDLSKN